MISRDHGQSFEEEDHEEEGYEESEGSERPTEPHLPTPNARDNEASALLISASDKAGMEGIDRERINAILLRESGNSTFMQRQRKMDENTNQKIADMKRRLDDKDDASGKKDWRKELEQSTIDPLLRQYQSQRQAFSTCVVIDMDGFFISCHILSLPHLAHIPACVGGTSMISTSNYAARKYGVRAAMPGYLGSTLVKELSGGKETLTFVKSDFDLYKRKSGEVRAVLEEYDPNLSMYSLDEAYMDIGPYLKILLSSRGCKSHDAIRSMLLDEVNQRKEDDAHNNAESFHTAAQQLLNSIRQRVKNATGLTCSAGLASNFLLAKVASDVNKPNGQCFVGSSEAEILAFANPLSIRKISGIGRVTEKMLRGVCEVETVKDLYDHRAEVYFLFKPASANFMMRASIGYAETGKHRDSSGEEGNGDNSGVDTDEATTRKGISHERTFSPTSSWSDLCNKLETIVQALVHDLKQRNLKPKTITLKVKLANFDILTRAVTLEVALFQPGNHQRSPRDILDISVNLLKESKRAHTSKNDTVPFAVRLLGVRCSNFQAETDNQTSLDRFRGSTMMSPHAKLDNSSRASSDEKSITPIKTNPYTTSAKPDGVVTSSPKPSGTKKAGNTERALANAGDATSNQQCPLCGTVLQTTKYNNAQINAHIDSCLNASTVKEIAREETVSADLKEQEKAKNKKRSLVDFFNT